MPVRIRLARTGRKKVPTYRVVVADSKSPRDGKFIEVVGRYDPRTDPAIVEIDNEKSVRWLMQGAQPSEQVRNLLRISGAWEEFEKLKAERTGTRQKAAKQGRTSARGKSAGAKARSSSKAGKAAGSRGGTRGGKSGSEDSVEASADEAAKS